MNPKALSAVRSRLWAAAGALTVGCAAHAAETAYVIDKLLVGVHAEQALDSAIVKVLPTGTKLEVLKREGDLAYVKHESGVSGWLDAGYLMTDTPAALRIEAVEARVKELTAALAAAEKRAPTNARTATADAASETPASTEQKAELEQRLASERLKVGELQARIAALQDAAQSAGDSAELARKNAELSTQLQALQSEGFAGAARRLAGSNAALLTLVLLVVIAFCTGAISVDRWQRRRRGGFRI
jgi:SH3 domain protein